MRHEKIGAVVRVSLGNFLEMYDFMVFGYYAAAIGRAFCPTQNEYASLMLSFMTFGTGYLMRPLGAILLGAYIDHHGRRKGLLVTLALMAIEHGDLVHARVRNDRPVCPLLVVLAGWCKACRQASRSAA
jgi:MFS family permease